MTKHFVEAAYLQRRAANEARLSSAGVYGSQMEHDACGVGFVATQDGEPNRAVVESAIEALQAIWHRGAVDADGMTGDGAGIHIGMPRDFCLEHIASPGPTEEGGRWGGGRGCWAGRLGRRGRLKPVLDSGAVPWRSPVHSLVWNVKCGRLRHPIWPSPTAAR